MKNERKLWLEEFLNKYGPDLTKVQVHMIKGEAGTQIPRLAKEIDVDLIVMGTVSRTGIPGLFMTSEASKIFCLVCLLSS